MANANGDAFYLRESIPPTSTGELDSLTFAVKDCIDVKGMITYFGNPDWGRTHAVPQESSPVVEALLAAGAKCVGKTIMCEMASSIRGENEHFGTPTNPAAPGREPGGSSSGSAVAVASGEVDFALGTDTSGSSRIPPAYCGVLGIRPTHGALSTEHVAPLSPSLDTVGWFARDPLVFEKVGRVLLPPPRSPPRPPKQLLIPSEVWELSEGVPNARIISQVKGALRDTIRADRIRHIKLSPQLQAGIPSLAYFTARPFFQASTPLLALTAAADTIMWLEFLDIHGKWIEETKPKLGKELTGILARAREWPQDALPHARQAQKEAQAFFDELLEDDALLCVPTTAGLPPAVGSPPDVLAPFEARAEPLVSLSALAGFPQVTLPAGKSDEGWPLAVGLAAQRGSDLFLLEAVTLLAQRLTVS
ncbi:aspartyl/glutamyl-tRNA amidotransferase subunit A [Klebsormidium nitens]|uniref:Aspartyl/glutamyl-tRNA amidotransferase subunit A n=1 Tax=Klebsormidium nitens TaxID=105231 RepID=A0A1Y1IIA7_KLENI|nr:aspartyl/glutamyl-tRNA amidotransferase subunit A [Klebsormidium nitens]|eukprot:GAQ89792.1 aspartyl/glutamyl-tRNA amidotransferase subunit A [Klebsormidium nitens]